LYDVLGVPEKSSTEEIRFQYKILARRHHRKYTVVGPMMFKLIYI